jgi:RNA recognition motif-containing protein
MKGITLFVGGLGPGVTAERLREIFERHGTVLSVRIPTVRDTTRSRPFGFVEMATIQGADAAVRQLDRSLLGAQRIRVEKAQRRMLGGATSAPAEDQGWS